MECWKCQHTTTHGARRCGNTGCYVTLGEDQIRTPLLLGDYLVVAPLGSGKSGSAVFKGWNETLKRYAALKWYPTIGNASRVAAALQEAQTLARFDHPNIVSVYECNTTDNFIALQLVEGSTLWELEQRDPTYIRRHWRQIALDVCDGLRAVHQRFIAHSDLKPGNIMIDSQTGRALLMDFGVAYHLRSIEVEDHRVDNASRYRAPELWISPPMRALANDVFSLGVIVYEMLSGERPFDAPSAQTLELLINKTQYEPLRARQSNCPKWVDALVDGMLQRSEGRLTLQQVTSALKDGGSGPQNIESIDDCQRMIDYIYGQQNRRLNPLVITTRLGSAMTGLGSALLAEPSEHANERSRYFIPRVLAWACASMSALNWKPSEAIAMKYPGVCPVCNEPQCACRKVGVPTEVERSAAALATATESEIAPASVASIATDEHMFSRIYGRPNQERPDADLVAWALIEVNQVSDAASRMESVAMVASGELYALELADVFAWLFALVDLYRRKYDATFEIGTEFLSVYPRRCLRCRRTKCQCDPVPPELRISSYVSTSEGTT